jgi:hypothetical protein
MKTRRSNSKKRVSEFDNPTWISKYFDEWLKDNRGKFRYPPVKLKNNLRGVSYVFEGVTKRIKIYMDAYQFLIDVFPYDIIAEFDVFISVAPNGRFFCDQCFPHKKYFTPAQLLTAHCFEPLLKWAHDQLNEDKVLVIAGRPRHWSAATILRPGEKWTHGKHIRFVYPVLLRNNVEKV